MDDAVAALQQLLQRLTRIESTLHDQPADEAQLLTALADLRDSRNALDTATQLFAIHLADDHHLRPLAIARAIGVNKSTVTRWISANRDDPD
ncbi:MULTISPECIES: helix-turn-helix domain-containing protein [Mycobacterium avium complex (MAC)]|uniref:helix-turn-helix domain-containing protein n=1 Tax=Mycobacterium avium complex (MAC) TaxID=120793 RepID=UPI000A05DCD2|nr:MULTISPECIES: hypothetical protein [Mycobacterium avium complex (MAC)]UCN12788.1 hypothetical protein LFT50_28095 [Mycobacterium intracellulare subsp. chimaera]